MDSNKERNGRPSKSHPLKRLKSVTSYPRKEPSFIVAFALHETYDNLAATQQNICCSKSPKVSDHTITPKISNSSCASADLEEKQNGSFLPETPLNNAGCDRDEGGDLEQKVPCLEECITIKKIEDERIEPELIFESSGHRKRLKQRKNNKEIKYNNLNKVKHVFNKQKDLKMKDKKISKYFGDKHINLNNMSNKIHSESVLKILSGSGMLKKVSAKEGLIEDQTSKLTNSKDSISASSITANESFFSYSSEDTLTFKESDTNVSGSDFNLSKNESASSVIRVLPDDTFKTVVNVSRAMIDSSTFGVEHNIRAVPSNSTVVLCENLTSTETLINNVALTSDPVSEVSSQYIYDNYVNSAISEISTERLTDGERISTTEASDEEDTFYNAKTSSYFNKSDIESNSGSAIQSERPDALFKDTFAKDEPYSANPTLMDKVIHLGMFSEIVTQNSNAKEEQTVGCDQNNANRIIAKNIAQKPFRPELNVGFIKPKTDLNFVNETAITDILQGNGKHENLTRTEEWSTNHPSNLPELWEKLLIALDSTAAKIEESLAEKIIKEMKAILNVLSKSNAIKDLEAGITPPISTVNNSGDTEVPTREVYPEEAPSKLEQGQQCNLVQSQLLDELMLFKNRSVVSRVCPAVSHQTNPKLTDCFEIFKPSVVKIIPDRGDLVTLTDEETVAGPSAKVLHISYPSYLKIPILWRFLKDNVVVLISVPVFLSVFTLFYFIVSSA